MVIRNSKNVQSFLASFFAMRSVIFCVHSNCAPVSKLRHCLQECNSNWQRGHWPLGSNPGISTAPQLAQRPRVTVPTMRGVRGPSWSCLGRGSGGRWSFFFSSRSRSRSWYPFWLYFRSMNSSGGMPHHTLKRQAHTLISRMCPTAHQHLPISRTPMATSASRGSSPSRDLAIAGAVITDVVRCGPSGRRGLALANRAERIYAACPPN